MPITTTASYGSWESPISAGQIARGYVRLGSPAADEEAIYWVEGRPVEGGRMVLMRRDEHGKSRSLTRAPYSVRSRVHEYGGRAYDVRRNLVVFVNDPDQRLYRLEIKAMGKPQPITPEGDLRFADPVIDFKHNCVVAVCEDHSGSGEPRNSIVSVNLDGSGMRTLAKGADFYASPALSPRRDHLAWIQWNHPNMPWDGTELWMGRIGPDGSLDDPGMVTGGRKISIFQPAWSPAGVLYYVSDEDGWWNLYRWTGRGNEAMGPKDADFGLPQWAFGMSTYSFCDGVLAATYRADGVAHLGTLDAKTLQWKRLACGFVDYGHVTCSQGQILVMASPADGPRRLVRLDAEKPQPETLVAAGELNLDTRYISLAEPVRFPTSGGKTAYGFYYEPKNPRFRPPAGEKPPLIVQVHGGPTGAAGRGFKLPTHYWTTRGFAVLDVNYRGSTGYGREYREELYGNWGVVDVDDCCAGAQYMAEKGLADPKRLAISGSSAGGFTVLAALTFRDVFHAGTSHYGVSDPALLRQQTHKFESHYLDRLIGPWPKRKDLYEQRSPVHNVDKLNRPVLFLQGKEDKVVPPNQAERMVAALRERGVPVGYVSFAGEQHGFRKAENIIRALEAELSFYGQIFGFTPADEIDPPLIYNL